MNIKRTSSSRNVRYGRPVTASRSTHRVPAYAQGAKTVQASKLTERATKANNRVFNNILASMTPEKRAFAQQLQSNIRKQRAVMGATNTSNIMAKPDFLELLPIFTQKLLILDVFGSVAMNSRQQLIPYFKVIAENTKGETQKGTVLASPFVNRQGIDPNFTGRLVKGEFIGEGDFSNMAVMYTPVLPGSMTVTTIDAGVSTPLVDDGEGHLKNANGDNVGSINYTNGSVVLDTPPSAEGQVKATYQYDNETVGPDENGKYGAKMGKTYLQLDEFNLVAEAMELACYWSVYAAFATQNEYGGNLGEIAKESAISELTAEINSKGFMTLKQAASLNPMFNWDASPVLNGSVVPTDYLNMFKLKLNQAAGAVYQATNLSRPNRLSVGTNVANYIGMINGFQPDTVEETVGPYHLGRLDQFEVFVCPSYDPNEWVMSCKSNDIRRNSALFGEYMPITSTDAIGLADASVQQGYVSMCAMKVVNPSTVVRGKLLGTY